MTAAEKPKRKPAARNLLAVLIAAMAGLFGLCYLVYRFLETGRLDPLVLVVLAVGVSIALPMLRANFFPGVKDCQAEYDFHERRLEERHRQRIAERLGSGTQGRVYAQPGRMADSAGEYCGDLLQEPALREDEDLRFALLLARARFFEQQGDPAAAVRDLDRALEIKPDHFFARVRLAMNHEWTGAQDVAAHHYRRALQHPGGLSRALKKLARVQIERLRKAEQSSPNAVENESSRNGDGTT